MSFEVPFIRPVFPSATRMAEDYAAVVASGRFSNFGPQEQELAQRVSDYVGGEVRTATVANATLGLVAALTCALDPARRGQSVLIPSFTFAAGPHSIEWAGFRPHFVDIDPHTLQPSLDSARAVVASGVPLAGILFCNTFGIGAAEVDAWVAAADAWGLPLVIDSAAGFGSRYADGTPLGAKGTCEVFSFHATKPFAVGEGGAVTSSDDELIDQLRAFENFGFDRSRRAIGAGLNAKLSEFSAALGVRQFEGFDESLRSRREVAARYATALRGSRARLVPGTERSSVCFASVVFEDDRQLAATAHALEAASVEFRSYYSPAVHRHPRFAGLQRTELPHTERAEAAMLSVPVHADMAECDRDRVAEALVKGRTA
jgi:dTDP-4-amino-4,6-dideoxygalactose transaminase